MIFNTRTVQKRDEPTSTPDDNQIFERLKPKQSTWIPPSGQFSSLDHYIHRCRTEINRLDLSKQVTVGNLSKEERDALTSLRNRTDIVIKPANKGGAVVVWDRNLYLEEATKQLSDTHFYQQIDRDVTETHQKEIASAVTQAITTGDLPPEARNLTVDHPRTSKFYMLPKIHKPGDPGRPIVSA